jgi:hypothetical protein
MGRSRGLHPVSCGVGSFRPKLKPRPIPTAGMKKLNAKLHADPEHAAQRAQERTRKINAKSFRRHRRPTKRDYLIAVEDFTETEDCSPVELVPLNPRCIEIASQFNKTPDEVAADINRVYLDSYRPQRHCPSAGFPVV